MARADLVVRLVQHGMQGDKTAFRKVVEAIIAEERTMQHKILADKLEAILNAAAIERPVVSNGNSMLDARTGSLFHEIMPRKKLTDIRGDWSLWRIGLTTTGGGERRILALFMNDAGKVYPPTARQIWEHLLNNDIQVSGKLESSVSAAKLERLILAAEEQGKSVYEALVRDHLASLAREREKNEYSFDARRKIVNRIGLPEVRNHRLRLLEKEERQAGAELERKARTAPDLTPILAIRVEGGGHG